MITPLREWCFDLFRGGPIPRPVGRVAAAWADEIEAVVQGGGKALLRQRLAALSNEQRRLVSQALTDVAA